MTMPQGQAAMSVAMPSIMGSCTNRRRIDHVITGTTTSRTREAKYTFGEEKTSFTETLPRLVPIISMLTGIVAPARYTFSYLEKNDYFTVSFFPENCRRDLGVLGSRSGRDGDKLALTGLTPVPASHGVDFAQAELTFVCRKLYTHQFEAERTPPEVQDWIYHGDFQPHAMFIGEIVDVVER